MFFTNFPLERSFDSSRRFNSFEVFLALLAWSVERVQLTSFNKSGIAVFYFELGESTTTGAGNLKLMTWNFDFFKDIICLIVNVR